MKKYIILIALLLLTVPSHMQAGNWLSTLYWYLAASDAAQIENSEDESDETTTASEGDDSQEEDSDAADKSDNPSLKFQDDESEEDATDGTDSSDNAEDQLTRKAAVLRTAIQSGASVAEITELLLDGADPDAQDRNGDTALHIAARCRKDKKDNLYWRLHDRGEDWNPADDNQKVPQINLEAQNIRGETSLHLAAGWGNVRATWWLINRTVNLNAKTRRGQTPLHHAAAYGRATTASALLKSGASLEEKDDLGRTPLHTAVARGNYDVAALLLRHNADVNTQQNNGLTVLHNAVRTKNLKLVLLILRYLPNPHVKDSYNLSAHQLAVQMGLNEIADVLLKYEQWLNNLLNSKSSLYHRETVLKEVLKALHVNPKRDNTPHLGIPETLTAFWVLLGLNSRI